MNDATIIACLIIGFCASLLTILLLMNQALTRIAEAIEHKRMG